MLGYALSPVFMPLLRGGASAASPEPLPLPEAPDGTVESFGGQQPEWQPCDDGKQCADVYAPVDWDDPAGERLTLRLVKQPASGGSPLGTLFVNPGGPGASGAQYVADGVERAVSATVRERYDVVGWDPRGVGASSPVSCLDAAGLDDYLFGDDEAEELERGSDEWIEAAVAESAEFGEACAERTGELLAHVGTDSTVRDLDMLRAIVGDAKLNYLGFSYGTYIGARYADAFPERVGRLVLDGAMDPATSEFDVVREQTRGFETALRAYVADCLTREDCPLSGTVDEAMAQIGALLDGVDERPLRASDGRTLYTSTMLTAIITPLYSQDSWTALDQLFASVEKGEADTAFWLADFYYGREDGRYTDNSTEAFIAINCADYPNDLEPELMRHQAAELERAAPTIGRFQGYGDVGCADWPVTAVSERGPVTGAGADPILVVGTTGDPATPYRWAESLAEQLESGVLVTYRGEGHTAYGENACVDETVDAYLVDGTVPAADPQCAGS
ncbi:alpha/beta fold hydrolase [Leucobacter sp. CSA1]|uniref:Alpha/beta fold hydrolase n=2 Tax=Leucobacter chromiisoli TaxID=2796471 RepID=A0A934Q877_9MICO|nr:alpha/beta fold hydrolase [Leucobacter chromiisoli]